MTEWQRIETAPTDGTEVLCFIPCARGGRFEILNTKTRDPFDWRDRMSHPYNPTHWMPLPEEPKSDPFDMPTQTHTFDMYILDYLKDEPLGVRFVKVNP